MSLLKHVSRTLEMRKRHEYYEAYLKATAKMTNEQKQTYADHNVMNFFHHQFHDIHDAAREHAAAHDSLTDMQKRSMDLLERRDSSKQQISNTLQRLVQDYASYQVSNPQQLPHFMHMVQSHPMLSDILVKIMNHDIGLKEAVDVITKNLHKEPAHDRHDLGEFQKALDDRGFGIQSPLLYSANALSAYRPAPSFIYRTTETPDERFIRMLIKEKQRLRTESDLPPVTPNDEPMHKMEQEIGLADVQREVDEIKRESDRSLQSMAGGNG